MRINSANIFIFSLFLVTFTACGGGEAGENEMSGEVRIDGSSTVFPITEAISEEFNREHSKVKVTVGLSGTGGGFKKLCRGDIDINNASRSIKQSEIEACQATGIEYVEIPVAYDGLSVVVHPENNWVNEITVAELKKIWEPAAQGTVTHWNHIRPEWPNEEIHLYGAGVESGTYDYFTEAIVGESHSSRGDYTASEDDNVLVHGISTDPLSLGFFGFAYYEQNAGKLKLIPVDDGDDSNGAGAVKPSIETVMSNEYTPLSRPLFIYVNREAAKRPEVQAYVNFYLSNAAILAGEVGFIPMHDTTYTNVQARFDEFIGTINKSNTQTDSETNVE